MYSSYIFEISLQKTIFLPLKLFFNSGITLLIFLGEIKKTNDPSNLENFFKKLQGANKSPLEKKFYLSMPYDSFA